MKDDLFKQNTAMNAIAQQMNAIYDSITKPKTKKLIVKHLTDEEPSFKVSPATKPSFDPYLEHIDREERSEELQRFQNEPTYE